MKSKPVPLNFSLKQITESKASAPFHRSRAMVKDSLNSSTDIQILLRIEHLKEQLEAIEKDLQIKCEIKSKKQAQFEDQEEQIKLLTAQIEVQTQILKEGVDDREIFQLTEGIQKEQAEIYELQMQVSRLDKRILKVENFIDQKASMLQKLLSEYINLKGECASNSRSDSESYHLTPSKSGGTRTFKKSQFSHMQFNQTPSGTSPPIRTNLFSVKSHKKTREKGI